ncbi:MAG TPA: DUF1080 domain-containing protein [Bryobacteraceae bacterium]|nr:DUF1080 domain-containing protein [Bryobacteraceae bacterium]
MRFLTFFFALLGFTGALSAQDGFTPLFDGKTLDGWEGDSRLWRVENGELVGSTDGVKITKNTFLIYRKAEFGDFVLRAEVKLRNGNSGIQFRSVALEEYVVHGLQADMAHNNWWGSIYDEKGKRGVMVNGWKGKAEKMVHAGWNDVSIYCQGTKIRVVVNGMVTSELEDDVRMKGVIALQLHTGPEMEARFRNIRIKTLE